MYEIPTINARILYIPNIENFCRILPIFAIIRGPGGSKNWHFSKKKFFLQVTFDTFLACNTKRIKISTGHISIFYIPNVSDFCWILPIFAIFGGPGGVAKIGIFQKKIFFLFFHPKRKPDPPREINFSEKKNKFWAMLLPISHISSLRF